MLFDLISSNSFLSKLWLFINEAMFAVQEVTDNRLLGIDMSIEGLRSQSFSVGIFVFLVVSLIFFSMIIYFYLPRGKDNKNKLKTGEKVMFGAIISGVFIAIGMGWLQLIEGFLL
jgi:hypothetical protein